MSVPRLLGSAVTGHRGDGDREVGRLGGELRVHVPVTLPSGNYRSTLTLTLPS